MLRAQLSELCRQQQQLQQHIAQQQQLMLQQQQQSSSETNSLSASLSFGTASNAAELRYISSDEDEEETERRQLQEETERKLRERLLELEAAKEEMNELKETLKLTKQQLAYTAEPVHAKGTPRVNPRS